jgi:hypothetical protein
MIFVCRSSTQRIFGLSPPVERTFPQMSLLPRTDIHGLSRRAEIIARKNELGGA